MPQSTTPLGMQSSIFGACPKPGQSGSVVTGRESGIKMGDDGCGSLISSEGVASSRMVGVPASIYLPLHHKVQNKISSDTGLPG